MSGEQQNMQKILVADDSEINRSILADMLGEEYAIIEAENGVEAVDAIQKYGTSLSLVLLDAVMPEMDGFGVLTMMNVQRWIEDIPVIMISAETSSAYTERAYELGVTDFIRRPFDALLVHRRVINTILLYAKQKKLVSLVEEQIHEKERHSNLMIDILSNVVEFRNGESGQHVRNVHVITELLLKRLLQKTDRYPLSWSDISLISAASAFHDIGKIAIDEKILNKPGKLTPEEYEIMKTHSLIGAEMLERLPVYQNEPLVKVAYEICRWHHERYDGNGYPDGLKGEEIPISAQIVALADVYDALTSKRVYKEAMSHEEAIHTILNGQCGAFNEQVLECLTDIADTLPKSLQNNVLFRDNPQRMKNLTKETIRQKEQTASERTLQLLEHERMKYSFFAAMTQEIQFELTMSPAMLTISAWGADKLGLSEIIMDPLHDARTLGLMEEKYWHGLADALRNTTPKDPVVTYDCKLNYKGELRWTRIVVRATWSPDEPPQFMGAIGKAIDIHDSRMKLNDLERLAMHDSLTGLLNHAAAKKQIIELMSEQPNSQYALVIFDLDRFKSANDTYGHIFGDHVLAYMAEKIHQSIRSGDIAARVGGDEFLIFLEYKTELEPIIQRIFSSLTGTYEDFTISVSMGVVEATVVGTDYNSMFHAADQALYTAKRSGRGKYQFYNNSMKQMLSAISDIDGKTENAAERTEQGGAQE